MKCIVLAVLCVLFPALASAADSHDPQETKKLLELAVSRTNIFDLPSFRMKATLQIGKLEGSYQLLWNGPDQWREEVNLPNYSEVQVGGKGNIWIQRSADHIPIRVYQLHKALGFGSGVAGPSPAFSLVRLDIDPKDVIKKMKSRKEHGEKVTCAEVERKLPPTLTYCISEATGALVRNSDHYSDSDFQPVGGKIYPRSLAFVDDGAKVVKVSITELVSPAEFSPNSFAPPAGVSQQAGCMNPVAPRRMNEVPPDYPISVMRRHVQGTVTVDTEIGADGVPKIKKVLDDADSELVKATIEAIAASRFEPATCDGKPVPVETIAQHTYGLSPH